MINNYLKTFAKTISGISILFVLQSCEKKNSTGNVLQIDSTDSDNDLKWVDFYNDEYELASDDGSVKKKYVDSLRIEWEDIYKRYDVILRERGKPIINVSGNQAFHYNSFDEIFIKKETKDTIENIGTWIVLWKKQKDDSWKIEFETYHAK